MMSFQLPKPKFVGEQPDPSSRFLSEIRTRNLIYHVYADRGHTVWAANLKQIKSRWSLFTGRKVIAVAVDQNTHRAATIRDILGPDAEYTEVPNDTRLREMASFPLLLRMVCNTNPHEATFFAHTKGGATFRRSDQEQTEGIMYWRNAMYHRLLDFWPEVHAGLRQFPMVGIFKLVWENWQQNQIPCNYYPSGLYCGGWMFAGTYYWFRHDLTFSNPKALYPADDNYGAEAWPSKLWRRQQTLSIFQPWPEEAFPNPNLYQAAFYDTAKGWDRISDE